MKYLIAPVLAPVVFELLYVSEYSISVTVPLILTGAWLVTALILLRWVRL